MSLFHPEQIEASQQIVAKFMEDQHYGLLWAQCQSGKTGTFHNVARRMLAFGLVDRVYLICGMSDTVLKEQAENDARRLSPVAMASGRFQIIFLQDIVHRRPEINTKRALIILDESHAAQDAKMSIHTFAARHGFDFCGTNQRMIEDKTFILSVSATPYSEICNILHGRTPNKFIVELAPGAGYKGIADYLYGGKIKDTWKIEEDWATFRALLLSCRGRLWNLVRIYDVGTYSFVKQKCEECGIQVFEYNGEHKDVIIDAVEGDPRPSLDMPPPGLNIVMIKGCLRAGKVVPKKFINMCWEDSEDPRTDTVVQSLLGRMCGYEFGKQLPRIFLPKNITEESKGVVSMSQLKRATMGKVFVPIGANCKSAAVGRSDPAEHERHPCVPIYIRRAELDTHFDTLSQPALGDVLRSKAATSRSKAVLCAAIKDLIVDKMAAKDCYSVPDRQEFLEALEASIFPFRHLDASSSANHWSFFRQIKKNALANSRPTHRYVEDPTVGIMICHNQLDFMDQGDMIIYFNSTHRPMTWVIEHDIRIRIPETTGKEMFHPLYRLRLSDDHEPVALAEEAEEASEPVAEEEADPVVIPVAAGGGGGGAHND
jgi:hypothetical protein